MIDEICVKDLALIEEACIEPAKGLTVLTGETGAGKTALLTSCKLLMGARGERSAVREGTDEACVEGRFYINDDEYVIKRRVTTEGRSRVQVNGQMASVGELADLIAPTIDVCSQHDSQELLRASSHVRMLDAWADTAELLAAYQTAYLEAQACQKRLDDIIEGSHASAGQLEQESFVLRQIDAVNPDVDEYEELTQTLKKAENSEALARSVQTARAAIIEEGGVLESANTAIAALEEGGRYDEALTSMAAVMRDALYVLEDVSRDVSVYASGIEFEPEVLVRMQDRMGAYAGLMRAYGPSIADVIARGEEARARIRLIDDVERFEAEARAELEAAEEALSTSADMLSAARKAAATEFAANITAVMGELEMGTASVECLVEKQSRERWGMAGADRVELLFRPAQQMQARPLSRIASGGELSRVLLALHVVMEDKDDISTLVFDEIDAGVGGATAIALAEVLVRLAQTHQVLVVTHLAQVAAFAEKHYVVRKIEEQGRVRTHLEEVEKETREREIARMLSGSDSAVSLSHARELINHSAF